MRETFSKNFAIKMQSYVVITWRRKQEMKNKVKRDREKGRKNDWGLQ